MNTNTDPPKEPIRLPKRQKLPFVKTTLIALAASSGGLLMMAVPNLISGTGILAFAKSALLATSATAVAYGINRMAIERGAPLFSIGYISAGIASVGSIVIVGAGLFAATFSGLTFKDVAELQLQEYGTDLTRFVGRRSRASFEAGRIGPAIRAITSDLAQKRTCELRSSCISGRGNGGRGPVTRALEDKAGRALTIASQMSAGERVRKSALKQLNGLIARYQDVIGSDKDIWERRRVLQKIDAQIQQVTGRLDEAVPVALIAAYARELESGALISGRPVATQRLNAILRKHAASLTSVLGTIGKGELTPPMFPRRTGVADTFNYLGHFAPIAAITGVVELVFPLALWLYIFLALLWANFKITPPESLDDAEEDQDKLLREGGRDGNVMPLDPPRRKTRGHRRPNNRTRGE